MSRRTLLRGAAAVGLVGGGVVLTDPIRDLLDHGLTPSSVQDRLNGFVQDNLNGSVLGVGLALRLAEEPSRVPVQVVAMYVSLESVDASFSLALDVGKADLIFPRTYNSTTVEITKGSYEGGRMLVAWTEPDEVFAEPDARAIAQIDFGNGITYEITGSVLGARGVARSDPFSLHM